MNNCAKARLHQIDCAKRTSDRSSRSQMFFKIGGLKSAAIFKENTCVGGSF